MITLTDLLLQSPGLDRVFRDAVDSARAGVKPYGDYFVMAQVRARHGFKACASDLLSFHNHKLRGAKVVSYGLTLFHFRSVLEQVDDMPRLSINACPHAGHCVKVCVLNNGNGRYDSVRRAWLWRTDLFARHPESAVRILAFELVRGVRKHGEILFRPNVNSDVQWERVLPSLCNGYLPGVLSYGYSKIPGTLDGDGWLGSTYRVAYSWNERSDAAKVAAFLARGGSVAIVSARRKGGALSESLPFAHGHAAVVDADSTDEWLLASGVVGDLSAKGKARQLIGRSAFVVDSTPRTAVKRRRLTVMVAA